MIIGVFDLLSFLEILSLMEVVFEVYVKETNDFVMETGLANVIY